MDYKLNRKEFFNILQKITMNCKHEDFFNIPFQQVKKFQSILDIIDLDTYNLNYIQNRFLYIINKNTYIKEINHILFCTFDTRSNVNIIENNCENTVFEYEVKKRNSYLTKPINEDERKKFTENTNEKDCIKGMIEPSILNSVVLYMLNNQLFSDKTLIVFSLKDNDGDWQSIDVLEYLQKYIEKDFNNLKSVIQLDFCSEYKGKPKKKFTGKVECALRRYPTIESFMEKSTHLYDNKEKLHYDYYLNRNIELLYDNNFALHRDLVNYFDIPILIKSRMFIFTDIKPTNKFSTFFIEKSFLVEWDTIESYINILINLTHY